MWVIISFKNKILMSMIYKNKNSNGFSLFIDYSTYETYCYIDRRNLRKWKVAENHRIN